MFAHTITIIILLQRKENIKSIMLQKHIKLNFLKIFYFILDKNKLNVYNNTVGFEI